MYIFYAKEPQTTPMKRSSEEVHTLPPKRKRLMITPVRKAVECTHAEGSTAVMVCMLLVLLCKFEFCSETINTFTFVL